MSRHETLVRLRHMLDHAREAVAMAAGRRHLGFATAATVSPLRRVAVSSSRHRITELIVLS
jgi:hypothetical protein